MSAIHVSAISQASPRFSSTAFVFLTDTGAQAGFSGSMRQGGVIGKPDHQAECSFNDPILNGLKGYWIQGPDALMNNVKAWLSQRTPNNVLALFTPKDLYRSDADREPDQAFLTGVLLALLNHNYSNTQAGKDFVTTALSSDNANSSTETLPRLNHHA